MTGPGVLAAGLPALLLGALLLGACSGADEPVDRAETEATATPTGPTSGGASPDEGPPAGTETVLSVPPGGGAGRCLPTTAEHLTGAELAVDATVLTRDRREVVLEPTRWFAGEPTETLTVRAVPEVLSSLLLAVDLREGERYLVAADAEGTLMVCGFSATWTPRLERIYEEAFGGR
ncbi:hypothetical protein [Nocardioides donggukensis]|uniref:Lipoprotein n=1 Tax=Nocardioides donggukensis TaxID=2774019 RepID=A0A927Q2B1_9ACTN|nr:hypothetical protein [Nocardioides donggukensis]MBD8871067.1 hypothetical protein [Nocardioides donggukensis]